MQLKNFSSCREDGPESSMQRDFLSQLHCKGMAVLRGLKFSFLYFPQKLAEQVSCLFRQAIVTARGVVFVPLASLLQSKVQR